MIPLLIDENLSRKLINSILDIFPQSKHIAECSLLIANDYEIWEFAEKNGFCILTKDWDFQVMSVLRGCPPKVIRLNCGNKSTFQIASIIISKFDSIAEFHEDDNNCYMEIE